LATLASCASALAACGSPTAIQRGHGIFEKECSSCHTLTGHETSVDGGDLAIERMSVADIASFARVMPLKHPLSRADARAVALYVNARRRAIPR
jgi:mono/diheme cytochrome c family protein